MMYRFFAALGAAALLCSPLDPLRAEVKLPAIFGDHMVLQQGAKIPVWGTAEPGEAVAVTVGKSTGKATAGADGKWRVDLEPLPASSDPLTLTVTGKNSVTCNDVLLGEVWICSGQSNMEFPLKNARHADTALPAATDTQIRFFLVGRKIAIDPQTELSGKWEVCSPGSAARFSAVGYFFGRDLRQSLNSPIGLIGTYWGGTPAQAWTSVSGLQKDGPLQHYVDTYQKTKDGYAQALAEYPAKQEAYKTAAAAWKDSPAGKAYDVDSKKWEETAKAAQAASQNPPPKPNPVMPHPPNPPEGTSGSPAGLFNGMVAPLIPYAIKGAIWYQGESNAGNAMEYKVLFARLITDWREKWGQGNFPFLFVQLAAFKSGAAQDWPFLREAQVKTLALPNTGMATAIDIGVVDNIHPQDKDDVGHRLALAARHIAYDEKLVYSGPIYQAMQVKGGTVSLRFMHTGGGLVIGKAPWVAANAQPLPTEKLLGFAIAGADKKFIPADARIDGINVVVASPQVAAPVAVRYMWANAPQGNLYNQEGLPASSFRTDDWPDPVIGSFISPAKSPTP